MKQLKTLPQNPEFFAVYAILIATLSRIKTAAQVVSGFTEVGIIYTASFSLLVPLFPNLAFLGALSIAVLSTLIIEMGLRVFAPKAVDAILYKRYTSMHLPMTILVCLITVVLLGTSGVLSFKNSKVIVDRFAPVPAQVSTSPIDSVYAQTEREQRTQFAQDSTDIVRQFNEELATITHAFDQRIAATSRELTNFRRREIRTGLSFATKKDQLNLKQDELKAEHAQAVAALQKQKNSALTGLKQEKKQALTLVNTAYTAQVDSIHRLNLLNRQKRSQNVDKYGLGLGWFTLVCLLIFLTAVILERVHAKGSGIVEKVEISQYDFMPPVWVNAWQALRERINYQVQERIKRFQDATPPAPLPANKEELYDPTAINNLTITLKLDQESDDQKEKVVIIPSKRRQIGFQQDKHTADTPAAHTEDSYAIKGTPTHADLRQWKRRLKDYKKRLGRHMQKKLAAERKGEQAGKRTLDAIDNNQKWVEHYTRLIQEFSTSK
ncbi:MAG: hypothetical protein ACE362_08380 [Phaeodactylibacter xiamenensis]|uniref:DUF4407 domain-containing protein n=1 Tax=Phaeodactylibacter xiamenensis TaxID=1524460 RepID=A0A098S8Z8_9BACT|nr:hypothetical protein [Phaeodactylibacter xiamenensis]KGE88586.1 hypothetical protein IX84_07870 [Phaeodactylibacter xiamenensis]